MLYTAFASINERTSTILSMGRLTLRQTKRDLRSVKRMISKKPVDTRRLAYCIAALRRKTTFQRKWCDKAQRFSGIYNALGRKTTFQRKLCDKAQRFSGIYNGVCSSCCHDGFRQCSAVEITFQHILLTILLVK